jgi:ABC-type bacteriocin/lantibiotic exporter with double-glycine peptidase domain
MLLRVSVCSSPVLWIHAIFAVVFLVIAMIFTRHFTTNLQYEEDEQVRDELLLETVYFALNIRYTNCYLRCYM